MNFLAITAAIWVSIVAHVAAHWALILAIFCGVVTLGPNVPLSARIGTLAVVILLSALWGGKTSFKL